MKLPAFWKPPQHRLGMRRVLSPKGYFAYLASMTAILLPFLWEGVEDLTGLSLGSFSVFVSLHVFLSTLIFLKGPYRGSHLTNAVVTGTLPFVTNPFQPFAWVFYLLSATNDALTLQLNGRQLLVLGVLPWVGWFVASVLPYDAGATLGSVMVASFIAPATYGWLGSIMQKYDRIALENEQLLEDQARLDERERISQDLHDGLGASLTGLALRCRVARQSLPGNDERVQKLLAEIELIAQGSLQQVRLTMRSFISKPLNEAELTRVLAEVCGEVAPDICRLECRVDERTPVSPTVAYHTLLIVAEAVNNAVRHGRADTIAVGFTADATGWRLEVEDNGNAVAGKGTAQVAVSRTIQKRAAKLQAELTAEPSDRGGIRLRIATGTQ